MAKDNITEAQARALARLNTDGVLYAYNGVSLATARILVDKGLATLHNIKVVHWNNRRSNRNHSQTEWELRPVHQPSPRGGS